MEKILKAQPKSIDFSTIVSSSRCNNYQKRGPVKVQGLDLGSYLKFLMRRCSIRTDTFELKKQRLTSLDKSF